MPLAFSDRVQETSPAKLAAAIRTALTSPDDTATLRTALILAGQLEQTASDAGPGTPLEASAIALADALASGFAAGALSPADRTTINTLLDRTAAHTGPLPVKSPEGFAYYALFPEQYAAAARQWLAQHPASNEPVLIIGIRSIGTTLSAVVRAMLLREGRRAHRVTLRPTGHPFDRQSSIPASTVSGAGRAIIVDEGPGQSGSSMVAAAIALERRGIPRDHITFLPGHPHGPGRAATDEVRRYWQQVPTHCVDRAALRWDDRSLDDQFREHSERILGAPVTVRECTHLFPHRPGSAPPAPLPEPPFERLRFVCIAPGGASVLWTFRGFTTAAAAAAKIQRRADQGWTPPPAARTHGFTAQAWPADVRPLPEIPTANTLAAIARYLGETAGLPLAPETHARSLSRLSEMLVQNTREFLGPTHALAARALAEAAPASRAAPSCTDAHLAPRDWVIARGRLQKIDPIGHTLDHTLIGPQPLEWGIAAALVEWRLSVNSAAPLTHLTRGPSLPFFIAAYASFRLAQLHFAAAWSGRRFEQPTEHYLHVLRAALTPAQAQAAPCYSRTAPTAPSPPSPPPIPTPG